MNVYRFDEKTKEYIGVENAYIDPLETELRGKEIYLLPANCTFFEPPNPKDGHKIKWSGEAWGYEEIPKEPEPPEPTLEELKAAKLQEAGAEFANRRDSVRFIKVSAGTYGFDSAVDDITNFMASWKAAEIAGETLYKVWLNDTEKGLAQLTLADFTTVFNAVRQSQYEDYAWYEQIKAAIEACETAEELIAITWEN